MTMTGSSNSVAPWCSEQQRGDGVSKNSYRIIGQRAVAASFAKKSSGKITNQKIIPKSNNQPMMMARAKATSNSSGSNSAA